METGPLMPVWMACFLKFLHYSDLKFCSQVVRNVLEEVHRSKFFFCMVDETTDKANIQQVTFCVRWVDESLDPQEDFIGLHSTNCTDVEPLFKIIQDIMLRGNLAFQNLR